MDNATVKELILQNKKKIDISRIEKTLMDDSKKFTLVRLERLGMNKDSGLINGEWVVYAIENLEVKVALGEKRNIGRYIRGVFDYGDLWECLDMVSEYRKKGYEFLGIDEDTLPQELKESRVPEDTAFYTDPQAIGTETWHRVNSFARNFVVSDGVIAMAKALGCFWFLDIIVSYLPRLAKTGDTFFVAMFVLNKNGQSGTFIVEDGNYNEILTQRVGYTDITENVKVYVSFDGEFWATILPSEY